MTAHVIEHPATIKAEIRSLVSLARFQCHRSIELHRWAEEARRAGKPDAAERWENQSTDYREKAHWHLERAMLKKDARHARS